MSGLTSQPNLGSLVERCATGRATRASIRQRLRMISSYWEQVRRQYGGVRERHRAGASEVYVHGMPGGQYTNLREQCARARIDEARWPEVAARTGRQRHVWETS